MVLDGMISDGMVLIFDVSILSLLEIKVSPVVTLVFLVALTKVLFETKVSLFDVTMLFVDGGMYDCIFVLFAESSERKMSQRSLTMFVWFIVVTFVFCFFSLFFFMYRVSV